MKVNIFRTEKEFESIAQSSSIGFVPTMGNLHAGHISLLERSLKENEISIMSIFVNPTQFAAGEDFNTYPRTFEADLRKIQLMADNYPSKEVIVFFPENEKVIYPEGWKPIDYRPGSLALELEGSLRPNHFDGVIQVVKRLFDIVKPQKAYFGQKDFQQLAIIKKMVKDLGLPLQIIGMPIVREEDGLAMSSRNQYLDATQRQDAQKIYRTLCNICEIGKNHLDQAQSLVAECLGKDPNWNYLTIREPKTLSLKLEGHKELVVLANYKMGKTKLLDNMIFHI